MGETGPWAGFQHLSQKLGLDLRAKSRFQGRNTLNVSQKQCKIDVLGWFHQNAVFWVRKNIVFFGDPSAADSRIKNCSSRCCLPVFLLYNPYQTLLTVPKGWISKVNVQLPFRSWNHRKGRNLAWKKHLLPPEKKCHLKTGWGKTLKSFLGRFWDIFFVFFCDRVFLGGQTCLTSR